MATTTFRAKSLTFSLFLTSHEQPLANNAGLKVNNQLVIYATRFLAVHLKDHVWSHQRALKAKVQCKFS